MTHHFNIYHAKQYGLSEAIFLQNLIFWIRQNAANGRHLYEVDSNLYPEMDGQLRYWTYNSVAAYAELFPYFTEKQVRNAIQSLKDKGVILKGNHSENKYDRTNWYALADENMLQIEKKAVAKNGKMDLPKTANGIDQEGECIQIEKQIKNNNNNTSSEKLSVTDEVRPTYQTPNQRSNEKEVQVTNDAPHQYEKQPEIVKQPKEEEQLTAHDRARLKFAQDLTYISIFQAFGVDTSGAHETTLRTALIQRIKELCANGFKIGENTLHGTAIYTGDDNNMQQWLTYFITKNTGNKQKQTWEAAVLQSIVLCASQQNKWYSFTNNKPTKIETFNKKFGC